PPAESSPLPYTTLFRSADVSARREVQILAVDVEHRHLHVAHAVGHGKRLLLFERIEVDRLAQIAQAPEIRNPFRVRGPRGRQVRSEEHTSELQSRVDLV